jgi:hypothetical protein
LGEFHAAKIGRQFCSEAAQEKKVCPSCLFFRRDNNEPRYFFLATFLAAAFFGAGLAALDLTIFLAMMFFELSLSMCGMIGFPAAEGIMGRANHIVNDRNEIIFAPRRAGMPVFICEYKACASPERVHARLTC